jgi:hypothetical protein
LFSFGQAIKEVVMQYLKKFRYAIFACLLAVLNWQCILLGARAADALQLDVPALVHGFATAPGLPDGDLYLLPKPLRLTLTQEPASTQSFAVSAESFGDVPEAIGLLPGVPANGFSISTPGEAARALLGAESIREVNLMLASTAGAAGDSVRVFAQYGDGTSGQDLLHFTVEDEGYRLTDINPHLKLFVDNRFALGPDMKKGKLVPFVDEAGPRGKRSGLLTLAFPLDSNSPLPGCFQLGIEIKRAQEAGTNSVVLSDIVVNRNKVDGDESHAAEGLLGKLAGGYPSGSSCKMTLTLNR